MVFGFAKNRHAYDRDDVTPRKARHPSPGSGRSRTAPARSGAPRSGAARGVASLTSEETQSLSRSEHHPVRGQHPRFRALTLWSSLAWCHIDLHTELDEAAPPPHDRPSKLTPVALMCRISLRQFLAGSHDPLGLSAEWRVMMGAPPGPRAPGGRAALGGAPAFRHTTTRRRAPDRTLLPSQRPFRGARPPPRPSTLDPRRRPAPEIPAACLWQRLGACPRLATKKCNRERDRVPCAGCTRSAGACTDR